MSHSPVVPPGLSAHECATAWSSSLCLTRSPTSCHLAHRSPPATAWPRVLSAQLPVSAPPTSLDECFCFNSLVVALSYILIFCQFWVFFVFKFVVVLLLVVQGGTVCLPMPPSWPEVLKSYFIDYAITVVPICLPPPSTPHSLRQHPTQLFMSMSHGYISSLATPFPILYFTSPWLFCNYLFVLLNPLTSSPIPLQPSPIWQPSKHSPYP